jgi:hypothetical protein
MLMRQLFFLKIKLWIRDLFLSGGKMWKKERKHQLNIRLISMLQSRTFKKYRLENFTKIFVLISASVKELWEWQVEFQTLFHLLDLSVAKIIWSRE